jgi:GrpB-like predicted nucleotidyltransferase (UPF0157 family)
MTAAEPLGLKHREVVVVPYDARWPVLFEAASAELVEALGSSILAVHHVGSTSVPGLCAKPVLDLLVSVPDFHAATNFVPDIESIGYEFRPDEDIPDATSSGDVSAWCGPITFPWLSRLRDTTG